MVIRKLLSLYIIPVALALSACDTHGQREQSLAKEHCSTCHLFPEPALLDKRSWRDGVLPEMSLRMGLDISKLPGLGPAELAEILKALPEHPMVSEEDWQSIRDYYIREAPDSLPLHEAGESYPLAQFSPTPVSLAIRKKNLLTMLKWDTATGMMYAGTRNAILYRLRPGQNPHDSVVLPSPPSDILFAEGSAPLLSCMGIMDPNDVPAGTVIRPGDKGALIDSLKRPVCIEAADINADGAQDLVISAFGNFTGGLYVYEKTDTGFQKHIVHSFPGTRRTIIRDFNGDGLPDILALLAQGDEQIALFTNRGSFRFSYSILLKFPPVYGSSYFELADFDGDGNYDILYTNGDNADYSAVLKPYHGIRIFRNDGRNNFRQSWFFHFDGASMARAGDFDRDGDLDIAAISFFPDFKRHPERGFVYLENTGKGFRPSYTPDGASGRWITMETGDFDKDGDDDIVLGALAFSRGVPDSLYLTWGKTQVSLLMLKNTLY